ncbi:MAG: hypothetical protein U0670_02070 [Anaerolineae bacterium]
MDDITAVSRRPASLALIAPALVAVLTAAVSIVGLTASIYPTEMLRQAFVPNDVVNLVIGVPLLMVTLWAVWRGSGRSQLIGQVFLPGALFFLFYSYVAYVIAVPGSPLFAAYLGLVVLSAYAIAALLATLDADSIRRAFSGTVPERGAAGVLAALGVLFLLRALSVLLKGSAAPPAEFAVSAADLAITPAWIIGGVLLWRRQAFGYVVGIGLLFQAALLFVGLIVVLMLQPLLFALPFPTADVIVIASMGLVCFVPFGLVLRGMLSIPTARRSA